MYGALATVCGPTYHLAYETPVEAIRALVVQYPDTFGKTLAEGQWHVIVGDDIDQGRDLDEDQIRMLMGRRTQIHIVPAGVGAKKGGLGKILLGIVLIGLVMVTGGAAAFGAAGMTTSMSAGAVAGAGVATTAGLGTAAFAGFGGATLMGFSVGSAVMQLGTAMLLGGVASLLAPKPETNKSREADPPSYLFNGAINTTEEGGPIPFAFGEVFTGSQVISATIEVTSVQLASGGSSYGYDPSINPYPPYGYGYYAGYDQGSGSHYAPGSILGVLNPLFMVMLGTGAQT